VDEWYLLIGGEIGNIRQWIERVWRCSW